MISLLVAISAANLFHTDFQTNPPSAALFWALLGMSLRTLQARAAEPATVPAAPPLLGWRARARLAH